MLLTSDKNKVVDQMEVLSVDEIIERYWKSRIQNFPVIRSMRIENLQTKLDLIKNNGCNRK